MAYLPMDLDAKKAVSKVARVLGVPDEKVGWGLLELWEWCWLKRRDVVSPVHLRGFFGCDAVEALEAFGFLEPVGDGTYRVRGAQHFLGVTKQRSAAGIKRAKSGKRDGSGRFLKPADGEPCWSSESPAEGPPLEPRWSSEPAAHQRVLVTPPAHAGSATSGQPALTPNTQHPILNTPPAPPLANDLEAELNAAFQEATGQPYRSGHGDMEALRRLLATEDPSEIVRRFRLGLRRTRFPTVTTWAHLDKHWNACAKEDPPPGKKGVTANTSDAEFLEKTKHLKTDENGDLIL